MLNVGCPEMGVCKMMVGGFHKSDDERYSMLSIQLYNTRRDLCIVFLYNVGDYMWVFEKEKLMRFICQNKEVFNFFNLYN